MEKNKKVSKIPNMITNARLLFLPVLLFFILVPMQSLGITYVLGYYFPVQIIIALCLFILLALTDFLDGYLARKLNAITEYGKYMDPILDKILVLATLIALTSIGLAPA
jgi:CDP-diacylglycerol--glycerol-3-phosphate 3-phosphatidyltransferase